MSRLLENLQVVGWQHCLFAIAAFLFAITVFLLGACVGSFLNVVIYRLPRGLSVNNPKRSFCPRCKKDIPWYKNIPLVTWLRQRGKCAECQGKIPFRYFLVELLTACLFLLMWCYFSESRMLALFYMVMMALLVVIVFVDVELMLIPLQLTWIGMGLGLLGGAFLQNHLRANGWVDGFITSVIGLVVGFGALWLTVFLGKLAFGKKNMEFKNSVKWMLREPEEGDEEMPELCFVIDGEFYAWSDLFNRKSDKLIVKGGDFCVDGQLVQGEELVIFSDRIEVQGEICELEQLKSLSGKAQKVIIPREAMGMGDVYLMGMLGACLGWQSVLFIVFVACLFSILLAVLGRMGFGSRLPFGPSLAFGAVCWIFWGWMTWDWYFSLMAVG